MMSRDELIARARESATLSPPQTLPADPSAGSSEPPEGPKHKAAWNAYFERTGDPRFWLRFADAGSERWSQ